MSWKGKQTSGFRIGGERPFNEALSLTGLAEAEVELYGKSTVPWYSAGVSWELASVYYALSRLHYPYKLN